MMTGVLKITSEAIMLKLAMPFGIALILAGCQAPADSSFSQIPPHTAPVAVCGSGEVMMQTTLWFGLKRASGALVSLNEWQQFVADDVTPRFKDDYVIYDGKAQGENRKALVIVHQPDMPGSENINALRERYKARFDQQSVMRVDGLVCVAV